MCFAIIRLTDIHGFTPLTCAHKHFTYWLLWRDCLSALTGGFDPRYERRACLAISLKMNMLDIDFPPESTLITECNVNLTDLLKDY